MQRGITIRVLSKDIKVYPVLNLHKQVTKSGSMHMNIYNFVKKKIRDKMMISGGSQPPDIVHVTTFRPKDNCG